MFEAALAAVAECDPMPPCGSVEKVVGLTVESAGPAVPVGECCLVRMQDGGRVPAEAMGFRGGRLLLLPYGKLVGIGPGSEVVSTGRRLQVPVGDALLGRVLDGLGRPIDGRGPLLASERRPVLADAPSPLERRRITEPISTGVAAIDTMLTMGKGQRMGIFSGSGVGKSVLLGMIARNTSADVNVICLVGERGREVREFIESDLGPEGLARSVVIVATSDEEPLVRAKAPFVACTVAEYFRDRGSDVMLMMDSLTRFAMAQREIGLAIGEPPTTRGYVPSVFALLPRLVERAGMARAGSITGVYTVLVEGDDLNEPVSDAARSVLDGHIVLSRALASKNHYPAIDVLASLSRLQDSLVSPEHKAAAAKLREVLATYSEAEDMVSIGAYQRGSNPQIDYALSMIGRVNALLVQGRNERVTLEESVRRLEELFS